MLIKQEIICVDAKIADVIKLNVFVAELENGHRVKALARPGERFEIGAKVMLELNPGDMAVGRIAERRAAPGA